MPKKGKQSELPGMTERGIPDLHQAALDYVDTCDQRMELTKLETKKKDEVKSLMHKHHMTSYSYQGVEITLEEIPAAEDVKIKVSKASVALSDTNVVDPGKPEE